MKISGAITVNSTQEKVAHFFADPQYLKYYQDGFIRKERVSGTVGQEGAIAMLYYQNGRHTIDLEETITKNELPNLFEAKYHHKHMDNTMKCRFVAINDHQTRYEYEYLYTRMTLMPKIMSWINPGMFSKPPKKWLQQFKEFVEKQ
ncbi:SRPBCC family protein [Rasiella rasia]|uniref:SRPBCC family protein n=1 Tax=Rasiella rasia TaxID=2744027 RepID=A0A6G6GMC3_9FLAO|nr:SRPBCC family protein [Rasiella rasia]QIE59640.1 SRPBCC family protein [Rasiella rasia]